MPAHSPPRGRPRPRHGFSPALQTPASRALRLFCATLSGLLQAETQKSKICVAPACVVRPGTSSGRLRRDVRRLADAAFAMAASLSRLARVAKARVHRRTDDEPGRHETEKPNAHESRTTLRAQRNIARTLSSQTRTLRLRVARSLRSRSQSELLRRSATQVKTKRGKFSAQGATRGTTDRCGRHRRASVHDRSRAAKHDRSL